MNLRNLEITVKAAVAVLFWAAVPGWLLLSATERIDSDEYEFLYHVCGATGSILLMFGAPLSIIAWVALGDYLIGGF